MGYIYEEPYPEIQRAEQRDGREHFTPREVIELMVNLVFQEDDEALTEQDAIRTCLRPGLWDRWMPG